MMIELRIEETNFYRRRPCLFCGDQTEKEGVIVEAWEDGESTGYAVCDTCLRQSKGELSETTRKQACSLRQFADELDALATDLPETPAYDEVQRRRENEIPDEAPF